MNHPTSLSSRLGKTTYLMAVVFLPLFSMSCSLFPEGRIFGGSSKLDVLVSSRLNERAPVAVDLAVVYDKALEEELLGLQARDWFSQRGQMQKDFPKALVVKSWEWVPGQSVATQRFGYRAGAVSVIVFASYSAPGDHRQRVKPQKNLRLRLRESGFTVKTR